MRRLHALGVGLPGDNEVVISIARQLQKTVDASVLGGVAVFLHGYARTTTDVDLYTFDRESTEAQLREAGARRHKREFLSGGVRVHTVTPDDAGHVVEETLIIDGVRVISLKDLVTIKLLCGWEKPGAAKHVGDVVELVRRIPLDKRFAGKLPPTFRAPFKSIVDAVRAGEKQRRGKRPF